MTDPKKISILDYSYALPDEKIALHPALERDASKLLIWNKGQIQEDLYKNIGDHLPENSFLVFNNTKVIKARIRFQKPTGAIIEIFCLEPYETINEYSTIMQKTGTVKWKCMIGGASKWKEGWLEKELAVDSRRLAVGPENFQENAGNGKFRAELVEKLSDAYVVSFSWEPKELSFAAVLESIGDIPLPPYIKRKTDDGDTGRYQTIYAKDEGSVAAPTAGLHFTDAIFNRLHKKNIQTDYVTLHVGAGTFKPVSAATMADHAMHAEWIDIDIHTLENLLNNIKKPITAVGTTTLRTLESLYWMGCKLILDPLLNQVSLDQWEIYASPLAALQITADKALHSLLEWMKLKQLERLFTQTRLLIVPGYRFRVANAIITNFHQPQSTLLLLVAAAIGNEPVQDGWKKLYQHALDHDYRFLSYGDGSLIFIESRLR